MLRRTIRLWLLPASITLLLSATACGSDGPKEKAGEEAPTTVVGQRVETEGGGFYVEITPQELRSMLDNNDFPLVNVHVPYEGEIEGTDLFVPYDQMGDRLGELPSQTDAKIVVYCRSGGMSAIAARTLVSSGYTNVWNLDGGMIAWEEAGYSLVDAQS